MTAVLLLALLAQPANPPAPAPRAVSITDVDHVKDVLVDITVLDTRPLPEFLEGHLPPAQPLDVAALEKAVLGGKEVDVAALMRVLERAPFEPGRPVVLYGPGGPAGREGWAAWLLARAGIPDVRLLDGGFPAWGRRRLLGVFLGYPVPAAGAPEPSVLVPRPALARRGAELASGPPEGAVLVDVVADDTDLSMARPGLLRLRPIDVVDESGRYLFRGPIRDLLALRDIPTDAGPLLLRGAAPGVGQVWAALEGNGFPAAIVLQSLP